MDTGTYKVEVYCTNCNFNGEFTISKGSLVLDADCPTCGNKSLEKKMPTIRIIPHIEDYR